MSFSVDAAVPGAMKFMGSSNDVNSFVIHGQTQVPCQVLRSEYPNL